MARHVSALLVLIVAAGCGAQNVGDLKPATLSDSPLTTVTPDGRTDDNSPATISRKIVYTASVELVVDDFADLERQLTELIEAAEGFTARFDEDRRAGSRLTGRWVVRIPVDQFDPFLEKVMSLGSPTSREIDAQDVTEEFIDLSARKNNKQQLERRLLDLLANKTGELKDVIEIETQLARVREEIESLEGKLRFLTDQVTMTTVAISAREDTSYLPPQSPSLAANLRTAFSRSLNALLAFFQIVLLAAVSAIPWLLACSVFIAPIALVVRSRLRR